MIETREGLDNLEAIVATPGLAGVYVGPADLALSLGLPPRGDTDEPRHLAAVEQILAACKRRGVPAGIHTGGPDWSRRRLAMGFDFVTLGTDAGFMMQAVTADLAALRAG
jgi:4-hydroxy-2-oxoheptanedioate aldolase